MAVGVSSMIWTVRVPVAIAAARLLSVTFSVMSSVLDVAPSWLMGGLERIGVADARPGRRSGGTAGDGHPGDPQLSLTGVDDRRRGAGRKTGQLRHRELGPADFDLLQAIGAR